MSLEYEGGMKNEFALRDERDEPRVFRGSSECEARGILDLFLFFSNFSFARRTLASQCRGVLRNRVKERRKHAD